MTIEDYLSSGLADEVLAHMEALLLSEQRHLEQQTGQRSTRARRRPAWKQKRREEAGHGEDRSGVQG